MGWVDQWSVSKGKHEGAALLWDQCRDECGWFYVSECDSGYARDNVRCWASHLHVINNELLSLWFRGTSQHLCCECCSPPYGLNETCWKYRLRV